MKTLILLACLLALTAHFEASKSGSGSNERRYWRGFRPQPAYFPSYARNPYFPFPSYARNPYFAQGPYLYPSQNPYFSQPQYYYVFLPVNATS